ncbi:MAG: AAA domain-containing protein [bacterium]|nr:AAA domain-containing protein [bacterium]
MSRTERPRIDVDDVQLERPWPCKHVFDAASRLALNVALVTERPLLVLGEPGIGKSQLAYAAAEALRWRIAATVVDARTESRALMWSFDPVARLAEAQVRREQSPDLDVENFIRPGVLWWAFDSEGAARHLAELHKRRPSVAPCHDEGVGPRVVLIDEIDKAPPDVPNGLLEALGNGEFTPDGCERVERNGERPLVVVTTNEERELPYAFVRRCIVHRMRLPSEPTRLKEELIVLAAAHFGNRIEAPTVEAAADMLIADRDDVPLDSGRAPGKAEFLDYLRAVHELDATDEELGDVRRLTLQKHVRE